MATTQIHALVKGSNKIGGYFDANCPIGDVIMYLMMDAKHDNKSREYDLYVAPSDGERMLIGSLSLIDWS